MNVMKRKITHRSQIKGAPTYKLVDWWGCFDGMIEKYRCNPHKGAMVFKWRVRRALIVSELIVRVDSDRNWEPSKRLLKQMATMILLRAKSRVEKQKKAEDTTK